MIRDTFIDSSFSPSPPTINNHHFHIALDGANTTKRKFKAAHIISGGVRGTSKEQLYKETKLVPLEIRRNNQQLVTLYKMKHGMSPQFLCDLISEPFHSNYPLRNQDNMFIKPCRAKTETYTVGKLDVISMGSH